jgi:hypothetical protein
VADVLYLRERIIGGGRIADATTGQQQNAIYGRTILPARSRSFTHGTGSGQANKWHLSQRTLATTTFDLLDLAGGLTDYKGAAITFTKIKRVYVAIVDPSSSKSLRVGPQNQSNAGQFGWGGTGATVYQTVYTDWDDYEPYAGWTVTAGTGDIYPIYNPSAGSVTYVLFVLGLG